MGRHRGSHHAGILVVLTLTLLRGWWERCEKYYLSKEEGRGVETKVRAARPWGPGPEPGVKKYRVPRIERPSAHRTLC